MTMEELAAMIEQMLEARKKIEEELRKTKELNFTLSRQVGHEQKSAEEILSEMF